VRKEGGAREGVRKEGGEGGGREQKEGEEEEVVLALSCL
jgi:hypothetical protein